MAFLTQENMNELRKIRATKRMDAFLATNEFEIEEELTQQVARIRAEWTFRFQQLCDAVTPARKAEVSLDGIISFDFGQCGDVLVPRCDWACDHRETYRDASIGFFIGSYTRGISRYAIWKSRGFLDELARRLELPEGAYLKVVSEEILEMRHFKEEDGIKQYSNKLVLVVRL
jgi:hypothetical protein